jgi:hypothetical protein
MKNSICRSAGHVALGLVLSTSLMIASGVPSYADAPANVSCLVDRSLADRLEFASAAQATKLLRRPDHWARQLSDFERSARMRTLESRSTLEFLRFAGDQGLDWGAGEEAYWASLAETLSEAAKGLPQGPLPPGARAVPCHLEQESGAARRALRIARVPALCRLRISF